jgi:hypothetical protein
MIVSSEGDIGDSVILMGIIKGIPSGPHEVILRKSQVTKMRSPQDVKRWHAIVSPLFESQEYIKECRVAGPNAHADWESGNFRGSGLHSRSASLFNAQISHLRRFRNIGHDITPNEAWLTVEPSKETEGRVVIARSGRYRNGAFPWQQVVDFYGDKLLFLGLDHEWGEFVGRYGMVERREVKDFLELAQLIAGSLLFIGNQSSPMTVCEGLKHRSIQETSTDPADCIYLRDNAQYCYNGEVTLPGFDKPDLKIPAVKITPGRPSTVTTPPGQWQYGPYKSYSVADLVNTVRRSDSIEDTPDLLDRILQFNVMRCPDFFIDQGAITGYKRVEQARINAGYAPRDFRAIIGM